MNLNNISKERFEKAKKGIIKKYPGAHTVMDPNGKYYVATEDGRDICNILISQTMNSYKFDQTEGASFGLDNFNATLNKVATIPHSKTIIDAWQQTMVAIKSYHVVNRNNNKFSDDKVIKKMAKDFE